MATSLTMEQMTSTNTKKTRSITNINPDATDQQLVNLATTLNALTTNTLKGINRVDKTEIDPDVVYSQIEVYNADAEHPQLPSAVTIDGLTININNASVTENLELMFSFRIKNVTNADIVFDTVTAKNTVNEGIYASYLIEYMDGTYPRSQIEFYYMKNTSTESATTTFTFPGGSVTYQGTTYYYTPFTLTVNQIG